MPTVEPWLAPNLLPDVELNPLPDMELAPDVAQPLTDMEQCGRQPQAKKLDVATEAWPSGAKPQQCRTRLKTEFQPSN